MKSRGVLIALVTGIVVVGGALAFALTRYFAPAIDDAIELIPADAVVYANAFLDPSSDQKMAVRDLLERFPDAGTPEEAEGFIDRILNDAFESAGLEYTEDVKPWLGKQVAFYVSDISPLGATGAALIATDDPDAALDAIEKAREFDGGRVSERHYEGVDYAVDEDDDTATGIVGDFVVGGTEDGFQAVVDASEGSSLSDSDRYEDATSSLTEDRLGIFYFDGDRFFESLENIPGLPPGSLSSPLLANTRQQAAAVLYARADGLVFESSSQAPGGDGTDLVPLGSGSLSELPADSWGAFGVDDVGRLLSGFLEGLDSAALPGVSSQALTQQLEIQTGLDLRGDVLSWMGDLGLFIQGTDPASVSGGVVIGSSDPTKSRNAVAQIGAALERIGAPVRPLGEPGLTGFRIQDGSMPDSVYVVAESDRVVLVYGRQAALDAIGGGAKLGGSEFYRDATGALGEGYEPAGMFDLQAVIALIENSGAVDDPRYATEIKPNLEPLSHIVFGSRRDGNRTLQRLVIGVR